MIWAIWGLKKVLIIGKKLYIVKDVSKETVVIPGKFIEFILSRLIEYAAPD